MKPLAEALVAWLLALLLALTRLMGPGAASAFGGHLLRLLGPLTRRQRQMMQAIALAFPDRDAAWHRRIALEAWENLGRTACEYAHLARLADAVVVDEASRAAMARLQAEQRPVLVFAAHLANWELPAVVAQRLHPRNAVLYRTPNNRRVAEMVLRMRSPLMGRLIPATLAAPIALAQALEEGYSIGMLVDQHFSRGPRARFFGQPVQANPLLPRLARRHGAALYGIRAVRISGWRHRVVLEGPFELPRDAAGEVDVPATTQMMLDAIERWVRENPGQWLWQHRRFREAPPAAQAPSDPARPA
ncbi:MAG: lipid A biosynthesis lauroyl acyltransferase [Rhodovarius sp.]|nr:lipid A biosynthesis lauroyl acyltransferase [Rhodovarius sp.]